METDSNRSFDNVFKTSATSENDGKINVSVELVYTDRVNFAVQQNLKSIFQELIVSNDSERPVQNLRVVVKSKQNLFEPIEERIDRIDPQRRCRVAKFVEKLNVELLAQTTERFQGEIEVAVFDVDPAVENATPLFSERYPITIFPREEWFGVSAFPSLLASFATPNATGITKIASDACEIMKSKGESESLEGYQSGDKNRVYQIIQAAYEAVLQQGIRYANPPASFEAEGQRIRLVDQILREKFATCLDLSMLFASVLESCGLNPIVLLLRGHAFVGCHTTDETFPEAYVDSEKLQAIRKRVDLDQIVVFETTAVVNGTRASFDEAEKIGKSKLEDEDKFEGALDVKRARRENIKPLPLKRGKEGERSLELDSSDVEITARSVSEPRTLAEEIETTREAAPKTRIDAWKTKLLDLTQRNKLLNFDPKKGPFLPFLIPESKLSEFEDRLSEGDAFAVVPPTDENDKDSSTEVQSTNYRSTNYRNLPRFSEDNLIDAFRSGVLYVRPDIDRRDANKRLTAISRAASTSALESGVNSLFLAFGTVERFDEKEKKTRRAPLLLIPVKLTGNAQKNDFCLTRSDEDATLNATLFEYLRNDFGKEIHGLDPNELPTDEHGIDVERIFQIFRQELRDFDGWELKNELTLGIFSFQKFVMWSDLENHMNDLMKNSIVKHLVETPKEAYRDGVSLVEAKKLDSNYSYSDVVTPLSADSSQLAAILTAEQGKSFVLQGPPGTGKSQTIANIIAQCLYSGRRVLFVAEKRAALEVVYRRLCGLGLGPFCLELHSNKSGKRQILDQLNEALEICRQTPPHNWDSVTRDLETYKRELNEYVEELHLTRPNGLTLYRALGWLASRENLKTIAGSLKTSQSGSFANVSEERCNALIKLGEELRDAISDVRESAWENLRGVALNEWTPKSLREIEDLARIASDVGKSSRDETSLFAKSLGIDVELKTVDEYRSLWELGRTLGNVDFAVPISFYSRKWEENAPNFRRFVALEREVERRLDELRQNGWNALRRESEASFKRGASNVLEIKELRCDLTDADDASFEENSTRRIRRDFAIVGSAFCTVIKKTTRRLGLKEIGAENVVWRFGELVKSLTVVKSSKVGFLLGDWNDFYRRTKKYADALRAHSVAQKQIAPFDSDVACRLELSLLESCDEASRLPGGIFEASRAYDSNALDVDAEPLGRAYGALLKEASELKNATEKVFAEIGAKDAINERNASIYRPIFKASTELPPRSKRFLSDDWATVAPRLRRCVQSGEKLVKARATFEDFNLNVVLDFDAQAAKRELELETIPRGVFAFANVRKQKESTFTAFEGLSLGDARLPILNGADGSFDETEKTDDGSLLDDFARKIDRLIRATKRIAVDLGVNAPIDETTTVAIRRLTAPMKEFAAPTDGFLTRDWREFSRDARTLIDARVQNEKARDVLKDFDLDKTTSFDVGAAREKLTKSASSFFLFRGGKKRAFVEEIKTLTNDGATESFTFDDLPNFFDAIESYVATKRIVDDLAPTRATRLSKDWSDASFDPRQTERLLELGDHIVKALDESSFGGENDHNLDTIGRFWFALESDLSPERAALQEFDDAWESYVRRVGRFVERVETIQDDLKRAQEEFDKYAALCKERFGEDWQDVRSDWATLLKYVDSGDRVAEAIGKTCKAISREEYVPNFLRAFGAIWNREKIENGTLGRALCDFCNVWDRCFARLREFAPAFNAWKENYRLQNETIRREKPIISERFSAESNPTEWENVADAGDEIVKLVGKFFANAETRETFLKKIDALWNSLKAEDSEDRALVDEFLATWKRYEEASERFFNALDELPPGTDMFAVDDKESEPQKVDLTNLAASLVAYGDAYSEFKRCESELTTFASFATRDGRYENETAKRALQEIEQIDALVRRVLTSVQGVDYVQSLGSARDKIGAILARATNESAVDGFLTRAQELENDFRRQEELGRDLRNALKFEGKLADATFADAELNFALRILDAKDDLRAWINWNQVRAKAEIVFPGLVDAITAHKIKIPQITDVVRYILYQKFVDDAINETVAIKEFIKRPENRERTIERFKSLDKEYTELARRLVVARLEKGLPTRRNEDAPRETELGVLRREINAKRHRKSVRAILEDVPTLLPKLKPCLLMSPLSVAQYFPSDRDKYDFVIFDEASQIPVWDAIGAIARGERLIVVGDSKQLPPTSFFQRGASDEDDELSDVSDPESILDECVAAQIPEIQLRWHYRSRREGLIAFSNSHYYGDRLYTFPSVDKSNTGVRFVYVENGVYDRGGSKTNLNEARALVAAVVKRLSDPAFAGKSLGIVTFNEAQKNAIEDLLDEERRKRPEIEPFFDSEKDEPVFVKNLENVQGDERDVMYFSICFGRDARGVVSGNFGPINKEGGERRLNVAITRAKEENVVFSSIRARDVKLTANAAVRNGVRDLKEFLDYAESGGVRLTSFATSGSDCDYESPFEEEVAKFLRAKGYEVKTQIGCSNYRIDLAIVAPDGTDEYVVGIECDGAAYHSSATARDRDFLRQNVLEGLGWRIVRVWSTRWFYERANAEKKLLDDVDDAFKKWERKRAREKSQSYDVAEQDDAEQDESFDSLGNANESTRAPFYASYEIPNSSSSVKVEEPKDKVESRDEFKRAYPSLDYLNQGVFYDNDRDFYDERTLPVIENQIKKIVEVEGPITENLVLERIKGVWNFSGAGARIKKIVESCWQDVAQTTQSDGTRVFWRSNDEPATFRLYRTGGGRKFADIPLLEFFNAVERVRSEYGNFSDEDSLYKEALKRFGIQRLTQTIKSTIEREKSLNDGEYDE